MSRRHKQPVSKRLPKATQPINAAEKVQSFKAVVRWIRAHCGQEDLKDQGHSTPHQAAMWFCAMREWEAGGYSDLKPKDWAYYFLKGLPRYTSSDFNRQFDEAAAEDPDYDLTMELIDFFGSDPS